MKLQMIKRVGFIFIAALQVLLTACSNSVERPPLDNIEGEFKIIWDTSTGLAPDLYVTNALQTQYPDAEFTLMNMQRGFYEVSGPYPNEHYEIVKNDVSGDLIMIESTLAPFIFKTGYLEPLDNYIESSLGVTDQLNLELLDNVREQGDGQIYGIPFGKNVYALYYNAEIFNELSVELPTDGMTWDELFDLARTIANNPLLGKRAALRIPDEHLVYSQFHIRILDPETGMPDANSPLWERRKAFFDKYLELYEQNPLNTGTTYKSDFRLFSEGRIAMIVGGLHGGGDGSRATQGFYPPLSKEWDMVSFPVFADATDTGPAPSYYYFGIPKNSERKREAFQMISHLLSDETQTSNRLNGLASVLNTPEVFERFGESNPFITGKHVQAYFRYPKEGTLGPDYNWEMQKWGSNVYYLEHGKLNEILSYHRMKLEEIGF